MERARRRPRSSVARRPVVGATLRGAPDKKRIVEACSGSTLTRPADVAFETSTTAGMVKRRLRRATVWPSEAARGGASATAGMVERRPRRTVWPSEVAHGRTSAAARMVEQRPGRVMAWPVHVTRGGPAWMVEMRLRGARSRPGSGRPAPRTAGRRQPPNEPNSAVGKRRNSVLTGHEPRWAFGGAHIARFEPAERRLNASINDAVRRVLRNKGRDPGLRRRMSRLVQQVAKEAVALPLNHEPPRTPRTKIRRCHAANEGDRHGAGQPYRCPSPPPAWALRPPPFAATRRHVSVHEQTAFRPESQAIRPDRPKREQPPHPDRQNPQSGPADQDTPFPTTPPKAS